MHAAIAALLLCAQLLALIPGAAAAPVVVDTITVGTSPYGIGMNPVTNTVYVPNYEDGNLSVIDGDTNTVTATVSAGNHPWGVGVNPSTNMIYVSNWDGNTVSVIDGATNTELTEIPVNAAPAYVCVNPVTNRVYTANWGTDTVTVIDGATNTVVTTVAVGDTPHGVCVNPVTNLVYAANLGSDTVTVIDGADNTVTDTITVGDGPHGIAANPITNTVYVSNVYTNAVSVIDGATGTVTDTVAVGDQPCYVGVNPAANLVYTSNYASDTVSVIDGADNTVTATLGVGNVPHGNAVNPETGIVYVTNSYDGTVSVIEDEDIVPFSDEFTETTLDPAWTWTDPLDDCDYSLTANPGHLRISAPDGGHDFWPAVNYNAPRVTQLVGGDFSIETRVLFDPQYHAQQAGILVWRDNDNFLLLNRRCSNEGQIVIYGADAGGTISSAYAAYSDTTTYLRMVRQGDVFSFLFGNDGISWNLLGSTTLAVTDPVEVGLLVMDQWQDNPIYADFDYFRFNQHAVSASVAGGGSTVSPATQVVTRGTAGVVDLTPDPGCYVASVTDNGTVVTPTPTDTYIIPCVDNNHEVVVTFSPFSDEFTADPLNPGWAWIDPLDECDYSLTANPGYLRISNPGSGHDLSPYNTDAPRVLQLVGGDFVIETSVLFNTASSSQGAGLLFFKDFDNYLRLERGCWSGPDVLMYGEVGGSTVSAETPFTGVPTFLRMARVGDAFSTYCSTDGTGWTLVGSTTLAVSDPVQVGLDVTQLTTNDAIYADFDYFRFITTVTSIDPASGTNDGVVSGADITGTGFREGAAVSLRKLGQDDIVAANVVVVSDTQITCDFDLDGAELGDWDVVVVNPDTQEGSLANGFAVLIGPLEVDSVAPNNRVQGSTINVTITGENLDNVNSVTFSGSGINVSNINVVSPTSVTCRLVIDPAAPVGPRDVTVSASDGKTDTLEGGFTVKIGAIDVTSVTPPSGARGSTVNVTITGKYLDNVDEVIFSPAGINVSDIIVASPTSVTCTLDLTGAAPGPYDVRLNASDGQTDSLADGFTVEPSPLAAWYLAEGSTDWGFDCYISVVNPNDEAVEVQVTYMTSSGPVAGPTVDMPAMSQATVFPAATLGPRDFSTKVECTGGQAISVDRTMYWTGAGAPCSEAHCATGVTSPAETWYMPEGSSAWGFECFLLIQNPNPAATQATVTWMIQGAGPQQNVFTVPANSRATYNMADYIGAADASIKVEADKQVICERAMYRDSRREGHDSGGTTTPAVDYYLAEGCSGFGFTTWVLVQNPQSTPTDVTIYYQAASGPVAGPTFTMPANSRMSVNVNDTTQIPGPDPSFSTRVHGSAPIIAERAMYWNGGADLGQVCHDSIGLSAPHAVWYLADGQSSDGRETWTLVQNPNTSAVTVRITYMTPNGTGNVVRDETIPANSRRSFNMADHSGISGRAAIMVECTTAGAKVMCERAMYWNDRGAGTDTIGGYSD